MISIKLYIFISFFLLLISTVSSISSNDIKSNGSWKNRPRQFRMQIFSRPYQQGVAQTIRADNGASTPCWNLASKRVGSYELNDPLVKVTFYRSSDCHGAPSATFYNQNSFKQSHILIKAKSVSVTKVKPVILNEKRNDL
ncbi:hypothetical protein BDF21DRAFT_423061 [Thamnidium elegans]|uniref:Uncharacterized protein n=1 Tax=Thamnidium elegans TaxID=101142 RepID=A0A8H7SQ56_9FUNG|nr:hypothetical protein INT48_005716 [Thamnidium elegans]KAI8075508.1 hypothetical protein BDF21DRAFT_423061 [Thamnidium elegans]